MNSKFKPIWQINYQFWIIIISLISGTILFFLGGPDYESTRSFKEFWNTGHIIYFFLAVYLLSKLDFISKKSSINQWLILLSLTLCTGILIEVLQYGTQRTPDIGDIIRDLTGSFLALSFIPVYIVRTSKFMKIVLQSIAITLLLTQIWPLAISLIDETVSRKQFPILSNFENPFELGRWHGSAGMKVKHIPNISTGNILEITLNTDPYSGIQLKYFQNDWRDKKYLHLSIYNPQTIPLTITCRIHDKQHTKSMQHYNDRFNRHFILNQGWNNIEINLNEVVFAPKNRSMNLAQISGIGIFSKTLKQSQIIYLDNVQLAP